MKNITFFLSLSFFLTSNIFSQNSLSCPFINAGQDQNLNCSSSCTNITASFFDIKETNSYSVESIPHTPPIPYNQSGGTGVSVNTDDVYGPIITLPFPFCYYGQTFTTCKIGSNGSIFFGPTVGGQSHPWQYNTVLTSTQGINNAGHVLGVYHDIDPSVCGNVKWYLVGDAPCRQFIVSYDNICQFSCTSIKSRHMMVLNEVTNYIDVYVESKPLCSWNGGNAIIGLQKVNQTSGGIAVPTRNSDVDWTVTTPEAWRFKPSGNPLYTFEWLDGTTSLGSSPTINVCPTQSTTYTAKFTYTPCGSTTPIILTDDVTITPAPNAMFLNGIVANTTCNFANGSVQLQASGGSGVFQFSDDSVNFGNTTTFDNLSAGVYNFFAIDDNGCGSTFTTTIANITTLVPQITDTTHLTCFQSNDGSLNASALGGVPPYSFSLNSGSSQSSGLFTNLTAGNYNVNVIDDEGCIQTLPVIISEPPLLELSLVSTISTTCNLPNGTFVMQTIGGVSPYMYSVDTFLNVSTTGIFENTYPGYFFINVADANGCTDTLTIFVNAEPAITAQIQNAQNASCFGYNDGSFDVNAFGAPTPYTYSFNGGPESPIFNYDSLTAGNYSVVVKDSNGCIFTVNQTITEPDLLEIELPSTSPACSGETFTYDAIVTGGTTPYTYLWNNANTNNPLTITPIVTTTYNLKVTDANGCEALNSLTQTILPLPLASATINPKEGLEPLTVSITNQSLNSNSYMWDFGNGNSQTTTNSAAVNASYPNPGVYYVTMVSSNGICTDSWIDSLVVYPVLEVEAPNVFTPNGDTANDGFSITTRNATGIEATIFNRWGNKIVDITDLNYKWDGKTEGGNELPDGVYFIKYKVTSYYNQEITGQTFFHLIR